MNGDNKVVGLWPRREQPDDQAPLVVPPVAMPSITAHDDTVDAETFVEEPRRLASWIAMAAAAIWLGLVSAVYLPGWFIQVPTFEALVVAIAAAAAPLVLIILVYTTLTRNDAQAIRSARNAAAIIRGEQRQLEATLATVVARLREHQGDLAQTNDALLALGEDAANRLKTTSSGLRDEIETLTKHGQSLKFSATSARADMAVLLADLPKAQVETRKMVKALQESTASAQDSAGALSTLVGALSDRGREANVIALGASQKLAEQLERIESVSASGTERIESAAQRMADAVNTSLTHADQANESIRSGIDAQSAALTALVEQSQSSIARTGADAATAMAARVDDVTSRLQALATLMSEQTAQTATLLNTVRDGLDSARTSLATLDTDGTTRTDRIAAAVASLDQNAQRLGQSLDHGTSKADALVARTETLITALDAALREVDESLPGAFERIDARLASTAPALTTLSGAAGAALDRLIEADGVLARQSAALDALTTEAERNVATHLDATARLSRALDEANGKAQALAATASTQLGDALTRIQDASQSAADQAREAIAAVIPQSIGSLSEDARETMRKAITDEVEQQIAKLGATAEKAVASANEASERLMRQMTTIAEISGSVEQRLAEGQASLEKTDSEALSRRVALLIESLNSTAIDVNKLLSNDVTDTSWAAYLRGDRGAFTRRAVKLLDAGEAREVLRHYESEPDFYDHVNRYIRDFELMLRDVLSTREGSALAITLLSSDMGKLYVALAQAIERLRTN